MAETTPNKAPLPLPEVAPRAATYGALFVLGSLLLTIMLYLFSGLEKRVERVEVALMDVRRELTDVRKEASSLRNEFVEYRAETRAELKALDKKLDEILELVKQPKK